VNPAWLLGPAWGLVLALPVVTWARRAGIRSRMDTLGLAVDLADAPGGRLRRRGARRFAALAARVPTGPVGSVVGGWRRRRRLRAERAGLARELPVAIDLLGVAVAAGCTPYLAVEITARWAPPRAARQFVVVRQSCALGASFGDALDERATAVPELRGLADALLASDRLGAPVGPALDRLATEERASLRRRAEAHARRVPVRMLFPLVFLVLPAFGLLTLAPALLSGFARS
jgi:tight adherence protein C